MFTGIIQEIGQVLNVEPGDQLVSLVISADIVSGMNVGASISINGTCLTAVAVGDKAIRVEVGSETLERTSMRAVQPGDVVNLELPMTPASLFDGHIVQGHVDGVGRIAAVQSEGGSVRIRMEASHDILRYLVEKGSVTVDGISLTVAGVDESGFEVAIIPHTLAVTTLGLRDVGSLVNLEIDVLAKYVERLLKN